MLRLFMITNVVNVVYVEHGEGDVNAADAADVGCVHPFITCCQMLQLHRMWWTDCRDMRWTSLRKSKTRNYRRVDDSSRNLVWCCIYFYYYFPWCSNRYIKATKLQHNTIKARKERIKTSNIIILTYEFIIYTLYEKTAVCVRFSCWIWSEVDHSAASRDPWLCTWISNWIIITTQSTVTRCAILCSNAPGRICWYGKSNIAGFWDESRKKNFRKKE